MYYHNFFGDGMISFTYSLTGMSVPHSKTENMLNINTNRIIPGHSKGVNSLLGGLY